jgi:CHASE2 domain-containing sensor protein
VDSFFDVTSGKIPVDKYKDKIVLIGPTAAGVGSRRSRRCRRPCRRC